MLNNDFCIKKKNVVLNNYEINGSQTVRMNIVKDLSVLFDS